MMKFLSYATATSVALVALQGCKSESGPDAFYKGVKKASDTITAKGYKSEKNAATYTTFEKSVKNVQKVDKKPEKEELKKYKIDDMNSELKKMMTTFCTLDKTKAPVNIKQYTDKIKAVLTFWDVPTNLTCADPKTPTTVDELKSRAKDLKKALQKEMTDQIAAKPADKAAIEKKFNELIQNVDAAVAAGDEAALRAAIDAGKAAVPDFDLQEAKKAANKRIAELKKINTKEAKDAIAAIKAAMNKKGATADEINKAVDAAKNIKPVPDADSAAMDKAYKAFVADLPTDEDKALETERVKDMSDDEKLAEYKQMKADFKTANPTKDFTEEEAVKAYKNTFDVYKTLQGEIKAANTDFDQDMTTYAEGADPKLTAELVKALKDQWKDASMTDALKVAQHKMFKSIKEGDKTENVPQFPSDDKTIVAKVATAAGDARDTEIRTNVVTVYKAIADRLIQDQQVKAAEEQHTKDMALTGADSVGLTQAQVDDETFRWGTVSKTDKIAQMGVINGKANAVEKKTEYQRLMTEAKATLTTAYATDVDDGITAAVDAVAPHADIRTQAKALFDALTLEQMTVQATELKSAIGDKTDAAKIAEQKKFVFGKLSEAADAQHTKDVDADPAILTTAGLLVNEKYRWTSIVDATADAAAKADLKVVYYVTRKALADEQPATIDAFYVILVNAAITAVDADHTTARANGAIVDALNQDVDAAWWLTVTTLEAKKTFMDLVAAAVGEPAKKALFDAEFDKFVKKWHTDNIVVLGNGDLNADEKTVETARFASLDEAARIAFWTAQRNNGVDVVSGTCQGLFPAFIQQQYAAKLLVAPVITVAEGSVVEAARWAGLAAGAKLTDFVAFHNLDNLDTEDLKIWFITKIGEHLATVKPAFTTFVGNLVEAGTGNATTNAPAEVDDADKLAAYKLVLTNGYDAATTTAGAKWGFEAAAPGAAKNAYVLQLHSDFEFTRIINLQADDTIGAPNNLIAVVDAARKTVVEGLWTALLPAAKRLIVLDLELIEAGTLIANINNSAGAATGTQIPAVADIATVEGAKQVRDNLAAAFVAVFP